MEINTGEMWSQVVLWNMPRIAKHFEAFFEVVFGKREGWFILHSTTMYLVSIMWEVIFWVLGIQDKRNPCSNGGDNK